MFFQQRIAKGFGYKDVIIRSIVVERFVETIAKCNTCIARISKCLYQTCFSGHHKCKGNYSCQYLVKSIRIILCTLEILALDFPIYCNEAMINKDS